MDTWDSKETGFIESIKSGEKQPPEKKSRQEKELDELLDLLEEAADEEGLPNHIKGTGTG